MSRDGKPMRAADALSSMLRSLDGRSYRLYRDLRGSYELDELTLFIDHVQGDPFAAPSLMRVRVPMAIAGWDAEIARGGVRRVALADHLARCVRAVIRSRGGSGAGSGKSGLVEIDAGGQEVLERTAVVVTDDWVEARLQVGLPAAGRRILGNAAERILCRSLPEIARVGLCAGEVDVAAARRHVECVENQESIRALLRTRGLVAFVANGSVLPRESGASDRPLPAEQCVAFESPEAFEVEFPTPNPVDESGERSVCGMGIREGVTLVVGGGYHGKSTLLHALERGVYPHVPGDGREYVVSDPDLVKIRAEDGRSVAGVDISAFIGALPRAGVPGARDTSRFSSRDASGSTSQAAAISEALELGASGLLLDEDTCATNFMVRDARMQALVANESEPITPFLDRIRELRDEAQVSTVLVMGGCGDYFEAADQVVRMREFRAEDATEEAHRIAAERPSGRSSETRTAFERPAPRIPRRESLDASRGRRDVKIDTKGDEVILYGEERIDLRAVEQRVDASQTRAIGLALYRAALHHMDGERSVAEVIAALEAELDERGLDLLDPRHRPEAHPGRFARPRRFEIAAALNRLRSLRVDVGG